MPTATAEHVNALVDQIANRKSGHQGALQELAGLVDQTTGPLDYADRVAYSLEVPEEHADRFDLVLEFARNLGLEIAVMDVEQI